MKKYLKFVIGIILIIVIVVLLNQSGDSAGENKVIKIGAIEPLSGFGAFWGVPSKIGAEMAVKDLAERGIIVDLVLEDSEGKPDKSVSAAQKLINIDKVDAMFVSFSGPSAAVSPVSKTNEKMLVYSAFDPAMVADNPFAVKTFFNSTHECTAISEYTRDELGLDKIGFVGVNLSFVSACIDEMVKVFGEDNVYVEAAISPNETDFRSSILKLKNNNVTFAVSYGYEGNYEAIIQQNIELDAGLSLFCIESDCYNDHIKERTPLELLEGSVLFDFQLSEEFEKRVYEEGKGELNYRSAAISYDAVNYIAEAIVACGDDIECQVNHVSKNKKYKSVISGSGFGGDRIFDIENNYYVVDDGELKSLDID